MPKIAPEQAEKRRRRLENAALRLFRRRGFHGVAIREIADEAGVSLGNIYTYYPGKEAIFTSVLERLKAGFLAPDGAFARYLAETRFPLDLAAFGRAVRAMVEDHVDYLTLIYVDIAEFEGAHVRSHYRDLAARFDALLRPRFDALRARAGGRPAVDPAVAFTAVYMQFFNYFVVERMIGARGHLGLSDEEAVEALSGLFTLGLGGIFGEEGLP